MRGGGGTLFALSLSCAVASSRANTGASSWHCERILASKISKAPRGSWQEEDIVVDDDISEAAAAAATARQTSALSKQIATMHSGLVRCEQLSAPSREWLK